MTLALRSAPVSTSRCAVRQPFIPDCTHSPDIASRTTTCRGQDLPKLFQSELLTCSDANEFDLGKC